MRMTMNRDVVLRRQRMFREHVERRHKRHEAEGQNCPAGPRVQGMRAGEVRVERLPNAFYEAAQKARPRPVTPGKGEAAQVQRYGGEQRNRDF